MTLIFLRVMVSANITVKNMYVTFGFPGKKVVW